MRLPGIHAPSDSCQFWTSASLHGGPGYTAAVHMSGNVRAVWAAAHRLHKLQAKHAQRQGVAQRARATAEEVAWDDEDSSVPGPASAPLALRVADFRPLP